MHMYVHVCYTGKYMQMYVSVGRYMNREVGTYIGTRVCVLDVEHGCVGIYANKLCIQCVYNMYIGKYKYVWTRIKMYM